MNGIIIACATLRRELEEVMADQGCTLPVVWLRAGAHNIPKTRREEIRRALEKCHGYDTVLLCMTFCGNALVGLRSGGQSLIVPRQDDCLALLLGGLKRPADAYCLSEGWLRGDQNLLKEYDDAVSKYGSARADRIFSRMLRNYRQMIWIGCAPAPAEVRNFSNRFSLELTEQMPDLSLLRQLIRGDWDDRFLIVPPDTEITLEMRKGAACHV